MKFNKVLTILLVLSCVLILNFCEKPKTVADPHKNAANRKSAVVAAESKTKIPPAGAKSNKTKKSKTKKSKSKKKSKDKNKSKGKKHYPKAGCNSKKNKKNQFYGFMCNLLPHLDANMDDHEGLDGCMLKLWKKGDSTDDVGSEAAFRDNNRNYQSVYNHIDQSTVLPCKAFKQDLKTYMKKGSGINRFAKVFVEYTPKPQHKNGVDKCLDELKSRNFLQKSIDLVKSPIVKGAKQVFKCLKKTKKVKPSFIANVDKFNKSFDDKNNNNSNYNKHSQRRYEEDKYNNNNYKNEYKYEKIVKELQMLLGVILINKYILTIRILTTKTI